MRLGVILGLAIVASLHAFAQTRTVETGDFFFPRQLFSHQRDRD
jgi:hypothetical protein